MKLLAKLEWQTTCPECNGNGKSKYMKGKACARCVAIGITWFRLGFTHVDTYEEALEKLLVKRNLWGRVYDPKDKFFLVWERAAQTNPIDITKAVDWRIRDWTAKELDKLEKESAQRVYDLANREFEQTKPTSRQQGKLDYIF